MGTKKLYQTLALTISIFFVGVFIKIPDAYAAEVTVCNDPTNTVCDKWDAGCFDNSYKTSFCSSSSYGLECECNHCADFLSGGWACEYDASSSSWLLESTDPNTETCEQGKTYKASSCGGANDCCNTQSYNEGTTCEAFGLGWQCLLICDGGPYVTATTCESCCEGAGSSCALGDTGWSCTQCEVDGYWGSIDSCSACCESVHGGECINLGSAYLCLLPDDVNCTIHSQFVGGCYGCCDADECSTSGWVVLVATLMSIPEVYVPSSGYNPTDYASVYLCDSCDATLGAEEFDSSLCGIDNCPPEEWCKVNSELAEIGIESATCEPDILCELYQDNCPYPELFPLSCYNGEPVIGCASDEWCTTIVYGEPGVCRSCSDIGDLYTERSEDPYSMDAFVNAFAIANNPDESIPRFISILYSIVLPVAVVIGMILIILAGYSIMTSQGDPRKVMDAKERLKSAIIGLLFVILGAYILSLIITTIIN